MASVTTGGPWFTTWEREFFIPKFNMIHIWSQLSKIITSCFKLVHLREYSSQNNKKKNPPPDGINIKYGQQDIQAGISYSVTGAYGSPLTPKIILSSHGEDYFCGLEKSLTESCHKEKSFSFGKVTNMVIRSKNNGYSLKTFSGCPDCTGPSSLSPHFSTFPLEYHQSCNYIFV